LSPLSENSLTSPTTIEEVMADPKFGLGVADARAGRGHHPAFDRWTGNEQWNYERGRHWATLTPRTVALKLSGKVTAEAVQWFRHAGRDIL